jgi:hypothetical protein
MMPIAVMATPAARPLPNDRSWAKPDHDVAQAAATDEAPDDDHRRDVEQPLVRGPVLPLQPLQLRGLLSRDP